MMEIGSEYSLSFSKMSFSDENLFSYLSDYNCLFTDSGRSALRIISRDLPGDVLLPEYICDSVIDCFPNKRINYYQISESGIINIEDLCAKIKASTSIIFVMHYFGVIQPSAILDEIRMIADSKGITVIEDTTQSIFSKRSTVGDYMIASIRKWMPIPQGGVLYSKKELPKTTGVKKSCDNNRINGMVLKDLYLNGVLDCNKTYREIFCTCERALEDKNIELMSDVSKFLVSCISIEQIIMTRKENYYYLFEALHKIHICPINILEEGNVPFSFTIRVRSRDAFRKYMEINKVFCAVHWPMIENCEADRKTARLNAETLISLPIDQRYGKAEMQYLVNIVKTYGRELSF